MPRWHGRYPSEMREQIIRLSRAGRTPTELSREFGCSAQAIKNWVSQALLEEGPRPSMAEEESGATSEQQPGKGRRSQAQRVGYRSFSILSPTLQSQLDGLHLDRVFTEQTSGRRMDRPQLRAAFAYLRKGDTLIAHSLFRLAPTVQDLLRSVRELTARGVTVEFSSNGVVFSGNSEDPLRRPMLAMLASFADFERELLRERHREGIARAKAKGVYKGRKNALSPIQITEMREHVALGVRRTDLARRYGISTRTLSKYLKRPNPLETS